MSVPPFKTSRHLPVKALNSQFQVSILCKFVPHPAIHLHRDLSKAMLRKILELDAAPQPLLKYYVEHLRSISTISDSCLIHPKRPVDHQGYPTIWIRELDHLSPFKAHRVIFYSRSHFLPDPRYTARVFIRHLCHKPRCINRDHLRPGTYEQNERDKRRRQIIL